MGIISNKAKAPTTVTSQAASPTITATTASNAITPTDQADAQINALSDAQIASESREQSLLSRSRGRLGTVLTSFRGFLNDSSDELGDTPRKTLLGE